MFQHPTTKSEYLDVLQLLKAGQSAVLENVSVSQEAARPAGSCDMCRRVSQAATRTVLRPDLNITPINPRRITSKQRQILLGPAGSSKLYCNIPSVLLQVKINHSEIKFSKKCCLFGPQWIPENLYIYQGKDKTNCLGKPSKSSKTRFLS